MFLFATYFTVSGMSGRFLFLFFQLLSGIVNVFKIICYILNQYLSDQVEKKVLSVWGFIFCYVSFKTF